jgi:hypothetical protein
LIQSDRDMGLMFCSSPAPPAKTVSILTRVEAGSSHTASTACLSTTHPHTALFCIR